MSSSPFTLCSSSSHPPANTHLRVQFMRLALAEQFISNQMSVNLKMPFKNEVVVQWLQGRGREGGEDKRVQQWDESTQQSLSYSVGGQWWQRNGTQLSYSMQTLENNELVSGVKHAGQYLVDYQDEAEMHSLFAFPPHTSNPVQYPQGNANTAVGQRQQMRGRDQDESGEGNENQKFDYSQELHSLRAKLVQIQSIAQLEIVRLKQQLARQKQLRVSQSRSKAVETRDAAVNTQRDCRDEEIEVLKSSILNHIDLNKKLLRKQVKKNSSQMQNVINKIQM